MNPAAWLGLIRFSHTVFALPFALLAALLAWATPLPVMVDGGSYASGGEMMAWDTIGATFPAVRWTDWLGILLCMVTARSAAMAFNRLADHHLDAANPRTAGRHLPAGVLSRQSVLIFTFLCAAGFVASTLLFLPNRLPLFGSVPVLAFLLGYSLAKRFTASAHLWLGAALALSPLCVWAAIRGEITLEVPEDWRIPLLLAGVVTFWVSGFDIIYACQDADYDSKADLHSVPARFGVRNALRIAAGLHGMMLVCLIALAVVGKTAGLGILFWIVVAVTAGLVVVQHWLVSAEDLTRVNQAFFHTNAAVSVLLLVGGGLDCWV